MEKLLHVESTNGSPLEERPDLLSRAADLLSLKSGDLEPLFWPPSRTGVDSAWHMHVPFGHWLITRLKPRLVVELGTHNGVSYASFCEAIARRRLAAACFAVDTWKGDEQAGFYGEEVYEDLVRFNSRRYAAFSELLRSTFDEAAPCFAERSIDFLHIDGFHAYETVRHDFETWLPKLSATAVVLFHDTNVRKPGFGAWKVFDELKQHYPAFEFLHGYGLGLVAVGTEVPPAISALCTLDEGSTGLIRECFAALGGFWEKDAAEKLAHDMAKPRLDRQDQAINSLDASLQVVHARIHGLEISLRETNSYSNDLHALLQETDSRSNDLHTLLRETNARSNELHALLQEALSRLGGLEILLQKTRSRLDDSAKEAAILKAEISELKKGFGENLIEHIGRIISWKNYDAAYNEWKRYKKKQAAKQIALKTVDSLYGVYPFFFFYPVYKTLKPMVKCKRALERLLRRRKMAALQLHNPGGARKCPAPAEGRSACQSPPVPICRPRFLRVVYISGEPDTPGHIYRVARYMKSLRTTGVHTEWIRLDELHKHLDVIVAASLLIIWRAPHSALLQQAVETARSHGAKVVFDIDDLMIDPDLARVEIIDGIRSMNLNARDVGNYYKKVQQVMVLADFCSAPTPELAAHIRRWQLPAFVLPNGYEHDTHSASRLALRKRRSAASDGLIRIGYATGSRTHQNDFAVAADAVARILREYPHCRLVLFRDEYGGPVLISEEFPQLKEVAHQIEWRTLRPVTQLPEELACFDINLAPLEGDNLFCEAKSELKYFEAALVEVPTIASPTGPFKRAIRHGSTGFLATQASEWYEALKSLVDDAELRRRVGKAAYRDVMWPYGPLRRTQMMRAALEQWCGDAGLTAQIFELELHRSRCRGAQHSIIIPRSDIVFEHDQFDQAEVTVVIPLYNYADYVEEALDSVLNQSLEKLDLIVIDDKSTDDSLNTVVLWAKGHKERFNRLLVLANQSNSGLGPTRNAGFDAADSGFILPLDADNRLKHNCCQVCLQKIQETGAAFIYPLIQTFGNECRIIGEAEFHPVRFIGGNYIDAMSLISKEAWAAAGGYGHFEVTGWEDFEFWCRLVELGLSGCKAGDAPLAEYRVHSQSMLQQITTLPHNKERLFADMQMRHPWLNLV